MQIENMQNNICVAISLPKEILEKIDNERKDIPRSRYILRIIERLYLKNEEKSKRTSDSLDSRSPTIQGQVNHFRRL
jgi:metal-responsive CopG/Arc/MetJ family transcriptional regulator